MSARTIFLENETGTRYALNGENGVTMFDVSGFGVDFADTYGTISDGYFMSVDRESSQQTIPGTVVFKGTDFKQKYLAFADFCLNAKALLFCLNPDGSQEYKRDVQLKFISRGEPHRTYQDAAVSFDCLGPWYVQETKTGTGSVSITAGGQIGTTVKITTTSAITNPVLTMTDADGEFQRLELTLSTQSGKTLEYSNDPKDSHIMYNGADAIQYAADLTAPIWGRSRKAFTISLPGAALSVTVKKCWRTV